MHETKQRLVDLGGARMSEATQSGQVDARLGLTWRQPARLSFCDESREFALGIAHEADLPTELVA